MTGANAAGNSATGARAPDASRHPAEAQRAGTRHVWTPAHARLLADARQRAGIEPATLARDHTLSVGQLRELESGGDAAFYSARIKYRAGIRLLERLGAAYGHLEAEDSDGPRIEARAPSPSERLGARRSTRTGARAPAVHRTRFLAAGSLGEFPDAGAARRRGNALAWSLAVLGITVPFVVDNRFGGPLQPEMPRNPLTASVDAPPRRDSLLAIASPEAGDSTDSASRDTGQPAAADGASCVFDGEGWTFEPARPSRPDDYVFMNALDAVRFCVRDAEGRVSAGTLDAGKGIRVSGVPPFRMRIDAPERVQVFYQGNKVSAQPGAAHWLLKSASPTGL